LKRHYPYGFLKRHDPYGFLKRHDPYGFLKRHDPTLGPLAQSAVKNMHKGHFIIAKIFFLSFGRAFLKTPD
jgi:hypothetical protein